MVLMAIMGVSAEVEVLLEEGIDEDSEIVT